MDTELHEQLSRGSMTGRDRDLAEKRPSAQSEAAKRALAEAEARRKLQSEKEKAAQPKEIGGREGPDPVRYGDWEKDGIASDF